MRYTTYEGKEGGGGGRRRRGFQIPEQMAAIGKEEGGGGILRAHRVNGDGGGAL